MTQIRHNLAPHLTHKANRKQSRYGWLRLTPAHSVHLITELLGQHTTAVEPVLDPFCGTGTTALVCAECGLSCDTNDINPFLLWLTAAKTQKYTEADLAALERTSELIRLAMAESSGANAWTPPLHQIEKWWEEATLGALGRALCRIRELTSTLPAPTVDLLTVVFCRVLIERSNVSFGHQSMSFKKGEDTLSLFAEDAAVLENWLAACTDIALSARSPILSSPRTLLLDARHLTSGLPCNHYGCVITSPPYPNRMSYIRELRPYMYWLGYLRDGRQAGEMDWQAIGGTWGCATSQVDKWEPEEARQISYEGFAELLARIGAHSPLLSRYVHKYFYDMVKHIEELFMVVKPGGHIHYIVGNSRFYDVLLPVEQIFAALFSSAGFSHVTVRTIRKRTSKKELFEYVVSACKP